MSAFCYCCFEPILENLEEKSQNYYSKFLLEYAFNINVNRSTLILLRTRNGEICPNCFVKLQEICIFKNQIEETLSRLSKIATNEFIDASSREENFDSVPLAESSDENSPIKNGENPAVKKKRKYKSISRLKKDVTCEKCGRTFETRSKMMNHRSVHKPGIPCTKCGKLVKRSNFAHHMKRHDKIPFHSCTECPQRFTEYRARIKHMETVHQIPMPAHTCDICQKVFHLRNALTKHITGVHIAERKHKCDLCSKSFVRLSCLKKHQLHHTGERKFKCEICYKRFFGSNALKEHLKIHFNIKEHVCHICNRAFTQKCSLKGHLRTHNHVPDDEATTQGLQEVEIELVAEKVKEFVGASE